LEHYDSNEESKLHTFIGLNTFQRFLNSFWYFFTTKAEECDYDIKRLNRVLETLKKTKEESDDMKKYIKDLKLRCKQGEIDSDEALKVLIEKTTSVEKLKASIGLDGSLAALMQMQEGANTSDYESTADNKLLIDGN
jgi:hypothetical protein